MGEFDHASPGGLCRVEIPRVGSKASPSAEGMNNAPIYTHIT